MDESFKIFLLDETRATVEVVTMYQWGKTHETEKQFGTVGDEGVPMCLRFANRRTLRKSVGRCTRASDDLCEQMMEDWMMG